MRHSVAILALLAPLSMFGCAHKPVAKNDPPPTSSGPSSTNTVSQISNSEGSCNSDTECKDGQLCVRGRCTDITDGMAECSQIRVHFALNSSEIATSDRGSLDRSARCLKADHALHVTVEGNADERGTEEYNLALGDRRATTVAKYLEALGASAAQLKTVSYGKEKPLCSEHDEDCWAKNRRAEVNLAQGTHGRKTRHAQ